jgi:hypothetical protein
MSALGVVLALATRVVTLQAADVAEKPISVRLGVGVESRVLLPDALVRLHGQHSAADLMSLKLGQRRPQTLLMFRPRDAGTGSFRHVGERYTLRLIVEASVLAGPLDVELRIAEPGAAGEGDGGSAAPGAQPSTASTGVSEAGSGGDGARSQATESLSLASAPSQVTGNSPLAPARSQETGAPSLASSAQVLGSPSLVPASGGAGAPTAGTPGATPAADGGPRPPEPSPTPTPPTLRPHWRIGRPGQRAVVIEELRYEPGGAVVHLRIEGAARAQAATLELHGLPVASVSTRVAGRDLVVVATLPDGAHPATLLLHTGDWTRTPLPLDALRHARALPGGSS